LVGGVQGACADQHRDFLACVQHFGRMLERLGIRQRMGHRKADAGVHRAVLVRRLLRLHLLHVVRHDDAGRAALGRCDAHGAIDDMPRLRGRVDGVHVLARDVGEERFQRHFLLIAAADRGESLLADDGDYRLMVELRVVQAVEQVDRAGTRSGQTNADLAGELGVCARHEGSHLFVAHLHVFESIPGAIERAENAVDAIAGIAEQALHAPFGQPVQNEIADRIAHDGNLSLGKR
jgi:hypothetical protein